MKFDFVKEQQLVGVFSSTEQPMWTKDNWFAGNFQATSTSWFEDNFGFRSYLVKTDNQINWTVFNEISSKTNTRLIRGLDNYLYEYAYIDEYSRRPEKKITDLEWEVQMLKRFQDELKKRGIEFLFVISPSKAALYPEYIPASYIFGDRQSLSRSYDIVVDYLDTYGVQYIDGHTIVRNIKDQTDYEVFTKGGTHWNYYAACKVNEQIIGKLEILFGKKMNHVVCDPPIVDTDAYGMDEDLIGLTNIWTDEDVVGSVPHPPLDIQEPNNTFIPNMLFVGDSFSHPLLQVMDNRVYRYRELLYYFKRRITFDNGVYSETTDDILNWERNIGDKDIVILENNESYMHDIGFGFVEYALTILESGMYDDT